MNRLQRRTLLGVSCAAVLALANGVAIGGRVAEDADRPNILFIMTDQHYAEAMSCRIGNGYVHTPALDRLAATGTLFTRAYTASPVCVPARNSIFTGRFPHDTAIECNRVHPRNPRPDGGGAIRLPEDYRHMGAYFRDAGYDTGYFGKWHKNFDVNDRQRHGFETTAAIGSKGVDPQIAAAATAYLKRQHERPFFAVVSFCDPHDICQYADGRRLPGGPLPKPPPPDQLPPLPPNVAPTKNEGHILRKLREAFGKVHIERGTNTEDELRQWRELGWAYYRLIERVDAHIGTVLDALEASGRADNTLVVYTSDHGELCGAHGLVQKTFFYEEAMRVPVILRFGSGQPGKCDRLIHNGIDLLPTLLDYAGIPIPSELPGRSLRPLVENREVSDWPEYVVGQVHFCHPKMPSDTPHTYGRMVRSERYKYWLFDAGQDREVLFDLDNDAGETVNVAALPDNLPILQRHRAFLKDHAKRHADAKAREMLDAPWR